ncbi:cilia- and flagella-associated protein 99 isoform 1-T2 [Synchiropus picturatus]
MAPNYGALVKEAIELLDKLAVSKLTLDDFLDEVIEHQEMESLQQTFLLEVVSGCLERKRLLDIIVDTFYGQKGQCLSRSDRTQFVVICYLATFSLDDLGIQVFGHILKSLDIKKMHSFISFFFDNLTTWIPDEWNTVYDVAYVEEYLIRPLLRWRPDVEILVGQLAVMLEGGIPIKKGLIKVTEPQEFCFGKRRQCPRPPTPPQIVPAEKHKPVPSSNYRAPKEKEVIEEMKQKNHQMSEELLREANSKVFRCTNTQKSEQTEKIMAKIQEEMDSKLKFDSFQSMVPPPSTWRSQPVRLNKAAVKRQKVVEDRQLQAELEKMEYLQKGGGESSAFLQWQTEMKQKDLEEELAKMERLRQGARNTDKEAAQARVRIAERNQRTVQLMKEEMATLRQHDMNKCRTSEQSTASDEETDTHERMERNWAELQQNLLRYIERDNI